MSPWALRSRYQSRIDKKLLDWSSSLSSLSSSVREQIHSACQLRAIERSSSSSPSSSSSDASASLSLLTEVRRTLLLDAAFNHRRESVTGYDELSGLLIERTGDSKLTFALLQSLNSSLKSYRVDPPVFVKVRNDALLMASTLSSREREMSAALNAHEFDVVDLSDILLVFLQCSYGTSLSSLFTLRCLDIALMDPLGAEFLFAPLYGLMVARKREIFQQNVETIFEFLADLPSTSTNEHIAQAFMIAYDTFRAHADTIAVERARRNWFNVIASPTVITFHENSGLPLPIDNVLSTASLSKDVPEFAVTSTVIAPISPSNFASLSHDNHDKPDNESSMTFDLNVLSTENSRRPSIDMHSRQQSSSHLSTAVDAGLLNRLAIAEMEASTVQIKEVLRSARQELMRHAAVHNSASILKMPTVSEAGTPVYSAESSLNRPSSVASAANRVISSTTTPQSSSSFTSPRRPSGALIRYSDINDYLQMPCLYMRGFLLKSKQATKFMSKHTGRGGATLTSLFGAVLHRRYFVLNGAFLTYFKNASAPKPNRDESIDIRQCLIDEIKEPQFLQFGYGFEIRIRSTNEPVTKEKDKSRKDKSPSSTEPLLVLFAANERERQTWLHLLRLTSGEERDTTDLKHYLLP